MLLQEELDKLWSGWKVDKELGEGAFGKVYRIEREDFGHLYDAALKVIKIPQSQSEVKSILNDGMDEKSVAYYFRSIVEDIVEELVVMSKLKGNTNIVSYEDHVVIPQKVGIGWNIYIRMELLTPLFEYMKEHQLTVRDIICLGIDICSALEVCQKYNIIHRDIKPENIFVSDLGKYKLGDFGIARQLEKTSSALSKKGTYSYMAPEVYKGEKYNSTVDIYSLGVVLYRFLNNNRTPFLPAYPAPITYKDKERANVMRMSGTVMPEPCNAKGRLAEIVLKACAYDPKERYESAADMRKALEAVLYEKEERFLIYPSGDQLKNEKVEYAKSAKQKREESFQPETTMSGDKKEGTRFLFERSSKCDKREIGKEKETDWKKEEQTVVKKDEISKNSEEETSVKKDEISKNGEKETYNKNIKPANMKKIIAVIVVCIGVILGFFCYGVYQKSLERKVPDLVNLTVEAATKKAEGEDKSLKIKIAGYDYSETVEKGNVISQNIKEGTVLKKGDQIEVIVSKGRLVEVPNLVGMNTSEAKGLLEEQNLVYKVLEKKYSDDMKKGEIISQDLKAGSTVEEQQVVSVIVSKGVEQVKVPDVEGKSLENAEEILKTSKLKYSVTKDYSSSISAGNVISQNVEKNKKVDKNTEIKLVVSLGKKPVQTQKSSSSSTNGSASSSGGSHSWGSGGSSSNDDSESIDSWDLVN